jgi:2-C-methyl-D-erythritol 4-phosphate cytidylyltransferase
MVKTTAIILAAGSGTRMKLGHNKMFYELRKPILSHTIEAFEKNPEVTDIVLVANESEIDVVENLVKKHGFTKVKSIVIGGTTRQESCYNGVMHVKDADIIMIQDGARPFVTQDVISNSIHDAVKYGVSVVGVPSKDTIKLARDIDFVDKTLDRTKLWIIQTPQTFKAEIIRIAHEKAKIESYQGTDDTSLAERLGYDVKLTMGHYDNIKITTPDDLIVAEKILEKHGDKDD